MHVLKRKPSTKLRIQDEYQIIGFISSGTYGRVYKANRINHEQLYAIKRFKKDSKDGDNTVNGISQSAVREMALCAELRHENVIPFVETILQDHSIFMIFEYCEHDLLQMISHHVNPPDGKKVTPIPAFTLQSIVYQLLQGVNYLHTNWVLHRDLKPANIMVTSTGQIKIGDLGLARIFREPIKTLYEVDKVVVTIWYRAPELLIGAKHYTPAIDLWAVGCIFGELLGLRPMFKGDEVKMDNRKAIPFQKNQLQKILDIMGIPEKQQWPLAEAHNDYQQFKQCTSESKKGLKFGSLAQWYRHTLSFSGYDGDSSPGEQGLQVLTGLLTYDDHGRLSAKQALEYSYFEKCRQLQDQNCFHQSNVTYPKRKITEDDPGTGLTGIKSENVPAKHAKKFKE
ncbi:MAG: cyclin-dependent protein kinase [Alyxoria varia]|nr:MAG: cyclin-dependent protein kinase [Alyxoria varia]